MREPLRLLQEDPDPGVKPGAASLWEPRGPPLPTPVSVPRSSADRLPTSPNPGNTPKARQEWWLRRVPGRAKRRGDVLAPRHLAWGPPRGSPPPWETLLTAPRKAMRRPEEWIRPGRYF